MTPRRHLKIEFDVFEFGIFKRRLLEGDVESSDDWTVGHPILFPNTLAVGKSFQLRVPIDDTHTLHFNYATRPLAEGEAPQLEVPRVEVPQRHPTWRAGPRDDPRPGHDGLGDPGSGGAARPREPRPLRPWHPYLPQMLQNIQKVARGEDPPGLIRDRSINEPYFDVPGMKGRKAAATLSMNTLDAQGHMPHTSALASV